MLREYNYVTMATRTSHHGNAHVTPRDLLKQGTRLTHVNVEVYGLRSDAHGKGNLLEMLGECSAEFARAGNGDLLLDRVGLGADITDSPEVKSGLTGQRDGFTAQ